jgi:hypothetical protein
MSRWPDIGNRACRNYEVDASYHSWSCELGSRRPTRLRRTRVILVNPPTTTISFDAMDKWLSNIESDTSSKPLSEKMIANKPGSLVDTCWLNGQESHDTAARRAANPIFGNAHLPAGDDIADDVMECQLKPLDRLSYTVAFTDAQWARLQGAFLGGVYDWDNPGVGQDTPAFPWLDCSAGYRGVALGAAPTSQPARSATSGPPCRRRCRRRSARRRASVHSRRASTRTRPRRHRPT